MQPLKVEDEADLEECLTRPRPALVAAIHSLSSPLVVLGAGGKMGPSLAVLARRAAVAANHSLDVIAVSRFRDVAARDWLEARGVRTLSADLLDDRVFASLPDSGNVAYLVGLKFGTDRNPAATWAANTIIPANVGRRYPGARIAALSTGNVYPFVPVDRGGAVESDPLTPLGEYANAAVGRERVFEWYSHERGLQVALLRLSYAVDLRYGVLVDIARKVMSGEAIGLGNGHFNCIWQGDANEAVLRSFALAAAPASAWNLCLPGAFSVRETAVKLGGWLGRAPTFEGKESGSALLSDPRRLWAELGEPAVGFDELLQSVARWVSRGGRLLDKPTHFEARHGRY